MFLIAVGLSMDAFAVSVCKGLSTQTLQRRHYLIVGAWFGGFQALMPALGYLLGSAFEQYITSYNNNYGLRRGSQPRLFPSQSRSC